MVTRRTAGCVISGLISSGEDEEMADWRQRRKSLHSGMVPSGQQEIFRHLPESLPDAGEVSPALEPLTGCALARSRLWNWSGKLTTTLEGAAAAHLPDGP